METRAPSVVAVVVTTQPGDRLAETLSSLGSQDYEELSILVLTADASSSIASTVARAAPQAYVAQLDEDRGYGAAINHALTMIDGASFLLLCHDDVVLDPDAVHLLVEEAFRSNAGIVTPKVVSVADRSVLIHVGQNVDRFATLVERVQPGEIDQGQHDAVRDVFVAPGGVTLIRDDLLRSIGGYDARYVAMGDDLELCWRARLAGARIICAPQATVAHAELLAGSARTLQASTGDDAPITLARLRRRNEIRTLLTCWGVVERILTLALLIPLHLAEIFVGAVGGDHERAVDIREAWRSWWRERRVTRDARHRIRAIRTVSDRSIRSFQVRGATRLRIFAATLAHHGFDRARGVLARPVEEEDGIGPELTASFGGAFSEDQGFDELDDLGRRSRSARGRRLLSTVRASFTVGVVLTIIYLVGSRNLIGARLPVLGQLVPMGSWLGTWHMVFASWQPAGLGSGAPGHPGYMVLGLLGTVTLGQMGIAVRAALLLSIPLGAYGTARLIKPIASVRARLLAAAAFFGTALGANAIAAGDVGAVVALGVMPFAIRRVLRLSDVAPYDEPFGPSVPLGAKGWRQSVTGQIAALGFLIALVGALAPATVIAVGGMALGIGGAGVLAGRRGSVRSLTRTALALLLAIVLLAPLSIQALVAGSHGLAVFGIAGGSWSTPGLWALARFAVGPNNAGPLTWLLPIAALIPLFIARNVRLGLAASLVGGSVVSLALALLSARGGVGSFAPDLLVMLAPAATGVAALVGIGLSSFEVDLPGVDFGWRQVAGLTCVTLAVLGLLPAVADASTGRWHMPSTGYADALSFLGGPSSEGHRILWLGDPRAIPGGSFGIEPGLAWATSTNGLPGVANRFAPVSATAGGAVTGAIDEALDGLTVHLGQLLAPTGISSVVVVTAAAPTLPGISSAESFPPPTALLGSLRHQVDLQEVPSSGSTMVFTFSRSLPTVATRFGALRAGVTTSSSPAVLGWRRLIGTSATSGVAQPGTTAGFIGFAPSGDFSLVSKRGTMPSTPAFEWAATGPLHPGETSLSLTAFPLDALVAAAVLLGWLGLALCLIGRHRWLDWWWRRSPASEPPGPDRSDPADAVEVDA